MTKAGNREAFSLAVDFFKGNIALSLGAIGILITVALLQMVPIVGIVFGFAYPILSLAVQVYVGRQAAAVSSESEMAETASRTTLSDLFVKHIDIATGAFLGFFILLALLSILFFLLMGSAFDMQALQSNNAEAFYASMDIGKAMGTFALFMILLMWLGYLMPGVLGEVILAEDFGDAFRKSLRFFSPAYWKRTFNKEYFILVFIWSIVVFVAGMVISWLFASLLLAPIALLALYCVSLYNAAVYVFAAQKLS